MSKSNEIQDLRGKFEPGDIPTSQDFNKLIDMATNADYTDGGTLSQEYLPKDLTLESVSGDGAGLTNLDANNIASGTVSTDLLQRSSEINHGVVKFATEQEIINGDDNVVVSADDLKDSFAESNQYTDDQMQNIVDFLPQDLSLTSFSGNGSGLTDLNATHISHGQINEARLPSASEAAVGAIRIATEDQVLNATAADLAVTPVTLGHRLTPINQILNDKADITYVDAQVANLEAGLKFKQDVALVSDVEVVDEMVNGGLIQIDGIQAQEGDRVLLTAQTDAQENRVWIAHEMSAWEIAEDFDEDPISELFIGTSVQVQKGNRYVSSIWTVRDMVTVGVRYAELTWHKRNDINNYVAGVGITIDDNTVAVDKDWLEENTLSEDRFNNTHLPSHIDLSQGGTVTGSQVKAESLIGDGSQITNLNNAHLPAQIDLTQGEKVIGSQVKADSFIGDGALITNIASENLPNIPNQKLALMTASNTVNRNNLPKASTSETGIIKFATAGEAEQGTANDVAISPLTLADAVKLEHYFAFVEDTNQTVTVDDIPDGKILALYTDLG